jgi:hypothetical protein
MEAILRENGCRRRRKREPGGLKIELGGGKKEPKKRKKELRGGKKELFLVKKSGGRPAAGAPLSRLGVRG